MKRFLTAVLFFVGLLLSAPADAQFELVKEHPIPPFAQPPLGARIDATVDFDRRPNTLLAFDTCHDTLLD